MREPAEKALSKENSYYKFGVTAKVIERAIDYVHDTLDSIDEQLMQTTKPRLSELIEFANLSSIIGNLFRHSICSAPDSLFKSNKPHKFPDIIANHVDAKNLEIKVALGNNKPKGHLVKPGAYITIRYVLADGEGT